jgi:hypothetical protein
MTACDQTDPRYQVPRLGRTTFLNIRAAQNPLIDPSSDFMFQGQVGSMYYVPGIFGPSSNRSATVQAGSTLFLNLINFLGENISDPADLELGGLQPERIQDLFLEIDGVQAATMDQLLMHRQVADENNLYPLSINSPDNLYIDFGLDPTGTGDPLNPDNYPVVLPSVLDGYWVALEPFAPGSTHVIHWGGSTIPGERPLGDSIQDNTLTIRTIPEPSAFALIIGFSYAGLLIRRR